MACQKFKTFRCLKTEFKVNTTTRRNAFIVDLLKVLLGLKMLLGGLKFPKTLRCYGSALWKANQKDNGIDQNIIRDLLLAKLNAHGVFFSMR